MQKLICDKHEECTCVDCGHKIPHEKKGAVSNDGVSIHVHEKSRCLTMFCNFIQKKCRCIKHD